MTPPDSGEREMCGSVIANVNGAWLCCDMARGHDGAHEAKLTSWLSAHGIVSISLPLAQRILAALEGLKAIPGEVQNDFRLRAAADLASELRAAVERKP